MACPHDVPQDSATGDDGRYKGAKPINLDNGEGKAYGIVTYPGGDRVDWKLLDLQKLRGDVDLKLQWTPPRPGLQLAFEVFDEWFHPVIQSKKTAKRKSKSRTKEGTITGATGKYFIRVFAVNRGDAGKYKLTVEFKEVNGPIALDLSKVDINDPPKLAAVPETVVPCDDTNFNPQKQECRSYCPANPPPNWSGCAGKCPTPPDANNQACWATMACPKPANRNIRDCMRNIERNFPPCADINNPDPDNPRCDHATAAPVTARVLKTELQAGGVVITIGAGSKSGVGKGWHGRMLRGDTDSPLDGGDVVVIRVDSNVTLGKVSLPVDTVNANPRVKLMAPAK